MRPSRALYFYSASAALLLVLAFEWLPASDPPRIVAARLPHLAPADQNAASKDTSDWADAILQRPLFTVGRRPPKAGHGIHTLSGTGLPRLAGIMITPSSRRAIFMPDGGKPMTLPEGASLDDDTIKQITPDRVLLSGPKGTTVLMLTYDKQQRGLTTPGAPLFPQPGFNPGFPNAGFNPAFAPAAPGFQGQPIAPAQPNPGADDSADSTPAPQPVMAPPFPGFRGPNIPRGRD
jgi:hypothetical protein